MKMRCLMTSDNKVVGLAAFRRSKEASADQRSGTLRYARPDANSPGALLDSVASGEWAGKIRMKKPDGSPSEKDLADTSGFLTALRNIGTQDLLGKLVT